MAVPGDNENWIRGGFLDSMAHVELLLCIESAIDLPGFFGRTSDSLPATIQSAVDAVNKALFRQAEDALSRAQKRASETHIGRTAGVVGWAVAFGSQSIPAEMVEQEFGLTKGALRDRAGMEAITRVSLDEDETSLAKRAAQRALQMAGGSAQGLHWIIGTSETFLGVPSFAASLHTALLAPSTCRVLDVGGACVGLLNCLAVADALLAADRAESILVATADVHSRLFVPGKVPGEFGGLFGDGASAFILRRSLETARDPPYSILASIGSCAGALSSVLQIRPCVDGSLSFTFDGDALALAALDRLERIVGDLETSSGKSRDEASAFAIHQPNPRLVEIFLRRTKLPPEKVPIIAQTRGNLGASTCGVALSIAMDDHARKPRSERGPIFVAAVGPGMLWAGAVVE